VFFFLTFCLFIYLFFVLFFGLGGGGGWQFLKINILAAKNLKINNLACVSKKIKYYLA
jgi:hypothetical protein